MFGVKIKLILIFGILALAWGQEITMLRVPLHADPRRAVELSCHFSMRGHIMHSVKWYRDLHEIFRYNPTQKPPIRLFNVTDVTVTGGECHRDECCTVVVLPPPLATRAAYSCEVSTEGPKFLIARQTKFMTVVALPAEDPTIEGAAELVRPGDELLLNCTTAYSLPPAEVQWYINNELQKPEPWERTTLSGAAWGGLRASWRPLRWRVPPSARGALRVRCEGLLRVTPPARRYTTAVLTVYTASQIDRYVANKTKKNICYHFNAMATTLYLLLVTLNLSL